jgi:hypothetical protein
MDCFDPRELECGGKNVRGPRQRPSALPGTIWTVVEVKNVQ